MLGLLRLQPMTDTITKLEMVLVHYRDGEVQAVTHFNNPTELLQTKKADRKFYEEFYECDTPNKT